MSAEDQETIFLVEDDPELAELVKARLEDEGFCVVLEANGKAACARILTEPPDLVVLDVMLPGMDGFAVCREIRPSYKGPILFLTARDDDIDQILGLELGADDYVTKPVPPRVLVARVRALLRRAHPAAVQTAVCRIVLGEMVADVSRREVHLKGALVCLTTVEFDLLWYLINRAGQVVSRQEIYRALFNYDYDGLDRSVDVYISRIRHKFGDDPSVPHYIKTVRGVGYLLAGASP